MSRTIHCWADGGTTLCGRKRTGSMLLVIRLKRFLLLGSSKLICKTCAKAVRSNPNLTKPNG